MKTGFRIIPIITFIVVGIFHTSAANSQDRNFHSILRSLDDSVIVLPNDFIIAESLKLSIDSSISLEHGRDYSVDSNFHAIILSPQLRKTFFSIPSGENRIASSHSVEIKYSVLPINLHKTYSRYQIPIDTNHSSLQTAAKDSIINSSSRSTSPDEKTMNLTKSGGITRGVQAGSTQDLSFTNSFNLIFSGNLGEELSFKGAVSEESTPLQPEGNTQILRDVDRIYIEMNAGKIFQATLGDYTLDLHPRKNYYLRQDPELDPIFNNFSRKVLGAKAAIELGPTQLIASASASKGKFSTLALSGIDAVQGPYRLQGKNGERDIIVIGGTEQVYIDGILMLRGELNDYVIDYGLAEIRFTNKRIITSSSRITVDFEYTNEQYARSLIAASQTTGFLDHRIQFSTSYIREGDDQDSPRNLSLSDSDRIILANAGADPLKAKRSGVIISGRDSTGKAKGNYTRIDTIISGNSTAFYRYTPFDTINAIYNISFGFAGTGKGSYSRKGIGEFLFVGTGLGDFDTTLYLPLPQLNQLFTGQLTLFPTQALSFTGEYALSELQPNRFAPINSIKDNAYRLYGSYLDTLGVFTVGANYKERFKGAEYSPIDRDRAPEELRSYGIDAPIGNYSFAVSSERERKAGMRFGVNRAGLELNYGLYNRGSGIYHAEKYSGIFSIAEDTTFYPHLVLSASHIPTEDSSVAIRSVWDSYSAQGNKSFTIGTSIVTPGIQFLHEQKASHPLAIPDSLSPRSFRFDQLTPSVDVAVNPKIKFGASAEFRSEDSSRNGSFLPISDAVTYRFSSTLANLSGFSSLLDIGYRRKDYSDSLSKRLNGGDVRSLLLRWIPRYQAANNIISIDGIYEASEQRAARAERIFFPVQKGLGNYKYLGDLNGNGKADPEEFALARYSDEGAFILLSIPTETLFPVTDLRSSLRLRFNPLPYLGTETSIRIEENSSDEHSSDIYLLKLSHFLSYSTTLRGLIETQQDVNILDNDPAQSYRLRFLERKNLIQYNTGAEKKYYREFSLRGRFRPTYELSNETNIAYILDKAQTDEHSTERPHNTERIDITTDWTFEPFASAFGFGARLGYSYASDNSFTPLIKATTNSLLASARYSITSSARLRLELGRDELVISNSPNTFALPYSITQGRTPGATWLWSLSLDVQIASGIVLTAGYNGRSELTNGIDRNIIHNARAEVRASF